MEQTSLLAEVSHDVASSWETSASREGTDQLHGLFQEAKIKFNMVRVKNSPRDNLPPKKKRKKNSEGWKRLSHVSLAYDCVKQPNIFSDHSQIVCWIKTGTDLSNNNNSFQEKNNVKLPQQYVWDETSAAKFTAAFRSNDILSLLHLFESTNFDLSSTDVENATNQFTNIMTEAAKRSLKLSSQKKSKRKPITKKWFDYDCKTLRSSLKKLSNKKTPQSSGYRTQKRISCSK